MTKEEYKQLLKKEEEAYKEKCLVIHKKYAITQRQAKKDDIIKLKDNQTIVKIKGFGIQLYNGEARIIYKGTQLKKDLTPYKNENIINFSNSDILKKIN